MFDILDQAIGESPVTTVRLDDVVTTGRRRVRRARLVAAGGVALTVAAVLGLSTLGVGGSRERSPMLDAVASIGWPTVARPAPATVPGLTTRPRPTGSWSSPDQDENVARLAATLEEDLRAGEPGLTIAGSDYLDGIIIRHARDPGMNPYDRYGATLEVSAPAGAGTLIFQAAPGQPLTPLWGTATPVVRRWLASCAQFPSPHSQAQCADSDGPEGQHIVVVAEQLADGSVRYQAFVGWAYAQVSVAISSSAVPPLTPTQLVLVASDPRLVPR